MSSHQLLPLEKLGEEFAKSRGWGHDKERIWNLKRKEKWNWAWAWWLLSTALHIATLLPWLRLKTEYIVNRVVAYLRDLFLQSPEKVLAQETVTCVDWLGSEPSAVCAPSCPTGTQDALICPGVKTGLPLIFCGVGLLCPSSCPWVLLVQIYLFKLFNGLGLSCFY